MNRKIALPKKSISSVNEGPAEEEKGESQRPGDVTKLPTKELNSDLAFESMQNSAIFSGINANGAISARL